MKIIEVRDGFIKFEADRSVYLSSFIQADGAEKSYIAQVSQIQAFGDIVIAKAKILFLYVNGMLDNYDKTEPSNDAELKPFTLDILKNSIKINKPVIIGKMFNNEDNITIDSSAFKKMLISVDSKEIHNTLTKNFVKQFENIKSKTFILDTLGIINAEKYYAGVDFKLPLNKSTLAFMYESCLNDATGDSKAMIVEIFKDLAEYSETVDFVPFDALKSVVNDMVDKQHVFKLLVLKNKLAKFDKLGLFASAKEEVDGLNKILQSGSAVLDFSKLDNAFRNKYLEYVYEKLKDYDNVQVFLELANTISKKNLKNILQDNQINTTIVTHSKYQYLNDIKKIFDNFIIEPSFVNNEVFGVYSTFLKSMQKGTVLVAGESVNYIPIVIKSQPIDEVVPYEQEDNDESELSELASEDNQSSEPSAEEELSIAPEQNEFDEEIDIQDEDEIEADDEPDSEDEFDLDEEFEEENENEKISQEELLAGIDEKSELAISSVAENYIEHQIDPFGEDSGLEDNNTDNVNEEYEPVEFAKEENDEELLNGLSDDSELSEVAQENEEEFSQEDLDDSENDESLTFNTVDNFENNEDIINADDLDANDLEEQEELQNEFPESEQEEIISEEEEETSVELNLEEGLLIEEAELSNENELPEELKEENNIDNSLNVDLSVPQVMPLNGEALNNDFDEIVELDPSESQDNDILVDMADNENINIDEDTEQQIIEDVDKVYTTIKDDDSAEEISDSDLDLIDELNDNGNELQEFSSDSDDSGDILSELSEPEENRTETPKQAEILEKRDSSTPIVPVYDADIPSEDTVVSDPIQQGDAVMHAKYGNGVVEKTIKYGNKTLFSINFENIGRRLLDPTLTELKKV